MALSEKKTVPEENLNLPIDIETLKTNPYIQKVYANSFTVGYSVSDATIVMQNGNVPVAILNVSFIALKTLANTLQETVSIIEKNLGEPLLDNKEVSKLFAKNSSLNIKKD